MRAGVGNHAPGTSAGTGNVGGAPAARGRPARSSRSSMRLRTRTQSRLKRASSRPDLPRHDCPTVIAAF